jgi:hypothetical protein
MCTRGKTYKKRLNLMDCPKVYIATADTAAAAAAAAATDGNTSRWPITAGDADALRRNTNA